MSGSPDPATLAYAQLAGLGVLWVSVHCVGMCGPLVIGLDVAGVARGERAPKGALHVLGYQLGRAMTYATLGALMGLLGAGVDTALREAGGVLTVTVGATLLAVSARAWWRVERERSGAAPRPNATFGRRAHTRGLGDLVAEWLAKLARALGGARSLGGSVALGALMGWLPCMVTLWALGLAATTGSAVHGAGVMVLLVAMTTPVLLGATLLPRALGSRLQRWGETVPRVLTTMSGVWLTLAGLAGLDVIDHLHVMVDVGGEAYALMLW